MAEKPSASSLSRTQKAGLASAVTALLSGGAAWATTIYQQRNDLILRVSALEGRVERVLGDVGELKSEMRKDMRELMREVRALDREAARLGAKPPPR